MATRRPRGSGSLTEVRPGVWRLVAPAGVDPVTGRRQVVRVVRGNKSEAQRALTALLAEVNTSGRWASTVTVSQMLSRFLAEAILSPKTREEYERAVDRVLNPRLGTTAITAVTPGLVHSTWQKAAKQGISTHQLRRAHNVLSAAFREARKWGWVAHANPCHDVAPATPGPVRRPIPSPEVSRSLLRAVAGDLELHAWLRLAIALGARRGEVLALRWGDINWVDRHITIDESVTSARKVGTIVKETKTGRVRHVALDDGTLAVLGELRAARAPMIAAHGLDDVHPNWLLLPNDAMNNPQRPDSVSRRFRRIRATVPGAEAVRLHDLRHAAASNLLAAGHDLRAVADRLGHERPSVTLEIYAGTLPASARAAADTVGELLAEPVAVK